MTMQRTCRLSVVAGALMVAVVATSSAYFATGQETVNKNRASDEKAIREVGKQFVQALENGNAKAVASFWTEEGEYIDHDSKVIRGRKKLESAYAKAFEKKPKIKVETETIALRFLSDDSAVQEGFFSVHNGSDDPPTISRYSILYLRENGQWRFGIFRESPTDEFSLKDIDWLIGTWKTSGKDAVEVVTTYSWVMNKTFIKVEFSVKDKDRDINGVQMIGVDPSTGQIRSWTFSNEGGFGEAFWRRDGKKWILENSAVLPDGQTSTTSNIFTKVDNDTFTWQSIERIVGEEALPDLPPVRVTRVTKK